MQKNKFKAKRVAMRNVRVENGTRISRSWERNSKNTEQTIAQGEKLFDKLQTALFAQADPSIDGMVAMTYGLSKTYVALKMALREFNIDVYPYFMDMVKFWEPIMEDLNFENRD